MEPGTFIFTSLGSMEIRVTITPNHIFGAGLCLCIASFFLMKHYLSALEHQIREGIFWMFACLTAVLVYILVPYNYIVEICLLAVCFLSGCYLAICLLTLGLFALLVAIYLLPFYLCVACYLTSDRKLKIGRTIGGSWWIFGNFDSEPFVEIALFGTAIGFLTLLYCIIVFNLVQGNLVNLRNGSFESSEEEEKNWPENCINCQRMGRRLDDNYGSNVMYESMLCDEDPCYDCYHGVTCKVCCPKRRIEPYLTP